MMGIGELGPEQVAVVAVVRALTVPDKRSKDPAIGFHVLSSCQTHCQAQKHHELSSAGSGT